MSIGTLLEHGEVQDRMMLINDTGKSGAVHARRPSSSGSSALHDAKALRFQPSSNSARRRRGFGPQCVAQCAIADDMHPRPQDIVAEFLTQKCLVVRHTATP